MRLNAEVSEMNAKNSWRSSQACFTGPMELTDINRDDFKNLLDEIAATRMPFGKFGIKHYPPQGVPIMDLPIEYLIWFKDRGFPQGRLGELLAEVCAIKETGMDAIFDPLRQLHGGRFKLKAQPKRSFGFD